VPVQQLGFHGPLMEYVVEPGDFRVWVGPNTREGLDGAFRIVQY
jgi:beta-glucosidase